MAVASDKARFFLEQSIPELKEYERKKIFTNEEITSIARKRSDFEHKINARGSTAADYARYAEFEINVDSLRRKRVKRLGIKSPGHEGQRRIFFIFDRGNRKHPGDVDLYMQGIDFARKQKAHKKLKQMFTNLLRIHPTKPDLWIYAAKYSVEENGDMTEARSYMQRGLRFCKSSKKLWLEYVRLEMSYIAKLHARRQILGIVDDLEQIKTVEVVDGEEPNTLTLPILTAQNNESEADQADENDVQVQNQGSNRLMSGAIPLTIYDAAMDYFKQDAQLNHEFFDLFYDYHGLPETSNILKHVIKNFEKNSTQSWHHNGCQIKLRLFAIPTSSPEYPAALRDVLQRLKAASLQNRQDLELRDWARGWLQLQLEDPDLDVALHRVLRSVLSSM